MAAGRFGNNVLIENNPSSSFSDYLRRGVGQHGESKGESEECSWEGAWPLPIYPHNRGGCPYEVCVSSFSFSPTPLLLLLFFSFPSLFLPSLFFSCSSLSPFFLFLNFLSRFCPVFAFPFTIFHFYTFYNAIDVLETSPSAKISMTNRYRIVAT